MSDQSAEVSLPQLHELEKPPRKPEIVNCEPLPQLAALYSIPLYKEWNNGMLLRQMEGWLSQHLDSGEAIEVSYVLNNGDPTFEEDVDNARDLIATENELTSAFIQKVVEAQRLSRELGEELTEQEKIEKQSQVNSLIEKISDPRQRSILQQSMNMANNVAFSFIDVRDCDLTQLGYQGNYISQLRTVGADYAWKRLSNKDAIFNLYDADTLPGSNNDVHQLLKNYKDNPGITYFFNSLSYLPPGTSKAVVAGSPDETLRFAIPYNLSREKGSPQISFRIGAYSSIQEIRGYQILGLTDEEEIDVLENYSGYEDYDTAIKLESVYGNLQSGILFYNDFLPTPMALTSDREGSFDGANRQVRADAEIPDLSEKLTTLVLDENVRTNKMYQSLFPEEKEIFENKLKASREFFTRRQKKQLRFAKSVVKDFIKAYENKDITIEGKVLNYDVEQLLTQRFGKALTHFMEGNRELVASLTPRDIEVMKYYLGLRETVPDNLKDPSINEDEKEALELTLRNRGHSEPEVKAILDATYLSSFHLALREYLGEYGDISGILSDTTIDPNEAFSQIYPQVRTLRKQNPRISILQPIIAETAAFGASLDQSTLINPKEETYVIPIPKPSLDERSAWISD